MYTYIVTAIRGNADCFIWHMGDKVRRWTRGSWEGQHGLQGVETDERVAGGGEGGGGDRVWRWTREEQEGQC